MLLSIDRVLQLLAEGKSAQKIAELSDVEVEDVYAIIEEARKIIEASDRSKSRKKIIIRKKTAEGEGDDGDETPGKSLFSEDEIFEGAELSAVPLGSSLMMYIDGASKGNPGPSGIGIVINDNDNRQVGKVSLYIGIKTNNVAEYTALLHALKIAIYFKTKALKIRTDSELVVKQLNGEYKVNNENIRPLYSQAINLKKKINNCKIEHVTRNFNDKADYLAKRASEMKK